MKKLLALVLVFNLMCVMFGCTESAVTTTPTEIPEEVATSEDATATDAPTVAEVTLDDYVYDGEALVIHLGDINSQFPQIGRAHV